MGLDLLGRMAAEGLSKAVDALRDEFAAADGQLLLASVLAIRQLGRTEPRIARAFDGFSRAPSETLSRVATVAAEVAPAVAEPLAFVAGQGCAPSGWALRTVVTAVEAAGPISASAGTTGALGLLLDRLAAADWRSAGALSTPNGLSRLLIGLAGIEQGQRVYDPTAGAAGLLLAAGAEARGEISLAGHEINLATWALGRLVLTAAGLDASGLRLGDCLRDPLIEAGELARFDRVVAHPPFGLAAPVLGGVAAPERFEGGESSADGAFLLHALASLREGGRAALVVPHRLLTGGERAICERLIVRGWLRTVISLPGGALFGTAVPSAVLAIERAESKRPVKLIAWDRPGPLDAAGTDRLLWIARVSGPKAGLVAEVEAERISGGVIDPAQWVGAEAPPPMVMMMACSEPPLEGYRGESQLPFPSEDAGDEEALELSLDESDLEDSVYASRIRHVAPSPGGRPSEFLPRPEARPAIRLTRSQTVALDLLRASAKAGDFANLFGPYGSGKTTVALELLAWARAEGISVHQAKAAGPWEGWRGAVERAVASADRGDASLLLLDDWLGDVEPASFQEPIHRLAGAPHASLVVLSQRPIAPMQEALGIHAFPDRLLARMRSIPVDPQGPDASTLVREASRIGVAAAAAAAASVPGAGAALLGAVRAGASLMGPAAIGAAPIAAAAALGWMAWHRARKEEAAPPPQPPTNPWQQLLATLAAEHGWLRDELRDAGFDPFVPGADLDLYLARTGGDPRTFLAGLLRPSDLRRLFPWASGRTKEEILDAVSESLGGGAA